MPALSWIFLSVGIALGIAVTFGMIFWRGRAFCKRMDPGDRGAWDRPLAAPLPKDTVVGAL